MSNFRYDCDWTTFNFAYLKKKYINPPPPIYGQYYKYMLIHRNDDESDKKVTTSYWKYSVIIDVFMGMPRTLNGLFLKEIPDIIKKRLMCRKYILFSKLKKESSLYMFLVYTFIFI